MVGTILHFYPRLLGSKTSNRQLFREMVGLCVLCILTDSSYKSVKT